MNSRKLIIISLAIPVLFVLLIVFRQLIEYYFRFSKEYRFIYSQGSPIAFFTQLFLVFFSFLWGIYIIINRRRYTAQVFYISLILGLSVFIYILIIFLKSLFVAID